MTALPSAVVMAAVDAYDAKRLEIHGAGPHEAMSAANKASIAPMIEAAVLAALDGLRDQVLAVSDRDQEAWVAVVDGLIGPVPRGRQIFVSHSADGSVLVLGRTA